MVYWMILPFSHYWKSVAQFWIMSNLLRLSLTMSLLPCTAALKVCSAFLSPLIPEARRLGARAGPVSRNEGGAGSWTRCTWPIREWLHPHSTDTGHISVSKLSPCKGSVGVETAISVKSDSPETIVREAGDMREDVNWPSAEIGLGRLVLLGPQ